MKNLDLRSEKGSPKEPLLGLSLVTYSKVKRIAGAKALRVGTN